jgi:pimeloyl-ACP methyl ester carboxylesterase
MILNFRESGSPGNTTVVFIHAFTMNSEMLEAQQKAQSPRYHTLALDLPGYGKRASEEQDRYSMEDFGDDIIETLAGLQIQKAVFAGCSIGGYLIFDLFRRYPKVLQAAIFCDTRAEADTSQARQKRQELIERLVTEGTGWYPDSVVQALLSPGAAERKPDLATRVKQWAALPDVNTLTATVELLANRPDSTPTLSSVQVPAMVLIGEHDRATPVEAAESIHKGIPQSRLHIIPDAGHLSPFENAEAVNDIIMDFLAALPFASVS